MSDHWIFIIPRDPLFVPSDDAIGQAESFMADLMPEAEEIQSEIADTIRFRDCGGNLESIRCPSCNAELASEWWSQQMSEDWDDGFDLHSIQLPCGHASASLNDLRYHFDQGFSRFILIAMNPNIGVLSPFDVQRFEEIIRCPVKVIYKHI